MYPVCSTWTTVPSGWSLSSVSNMASWRLWSNFWPRASMGVMRKRSNAFSISRSVISTPTTSVSSVSFSWRVFWSMLSRARRRLSATGRISRAKPATAYLDISILSRSARRRTFSASARARNSLSLRSATSASRAPMRSAGSASPAAGPVSWSTASGAAGAGSAAASSPSGAGAGSTAGAASFSGVAAGSVSAASSTSFGVSCFFLDISTLVISQPIRRPIIWAV